MKKNILIFLFAVIFVAGSYGFSSAQKKEESKTSANIMPHQMSEKLEDMGKMMVEMQDEMKNMDKMMEDSHAGMSNEDMAKIHERMNRIHGWNGTWDFKRRS